MFQFSNAGNNDTVIFTNEVIYINVTGVFMITGMFAIGALASSVIGLYRINPDFSGTLVSIGSPCFTYVAYITAGTTFRVAACWGSLTFDQRFFSVTRPY
jgi:hypothetical protein